MGKAQEAVRKALRERLKAYGWTEDRYGHFQKTTLRKVRGLAPAIERPMRIKFLAISVRLEVRGLESGEWIRFGGSYLTETLLLDDSIVFKGSVLSAEGFV